MTNVIDCKTFVQKRKDKLKQHIETQPCNLSKLNIVQVGNNPASNSYIKGKIKDCKEIGIGYEHHQMEEDIDETSLMAYIAYLNDEYYAGTIVQLPLPPHLDRDKITNAVKDRADIDGFKCSSPYTPCTPKGIMSILEDVHYDVWGRTVCVIGQGKTVGKPLFELLAAAGATVISCNSKTPKEKLLKFIQSSDALITAAGKAGMISKASFWNQDEKRYVYPQLIIDVGINRGEDGKLCGDCNKELYDVEWDDLYITPVPGGVGLYTRISLLENLIYGG